MSENPEGASEKTGAVPGRLRFGRFELDVETCELTRDGAPVKLQQQPCRVLAVLASRAGELVTREEIRKAIWGTDTWVNFDQGLNFCIKEVRAALGDQVETPRYVETLPRRGYRFIADTSTAPALRARVAVLPFDDFGANHGVGCVCDTLTEQLLAELVGARPEQVCVVDRRATRRFRPGDDVGVIGRALGADFVLEGVLKTTERQLTLTVRLIRVAGRNVTWSETFGHDSSDPAGATQELARRVSSELTAALLRR